MHSTEKEDCWSISSPQYYQLIRERETVGDALKIDIQLENDMIIRSIIPHAATMSLIC